MRKRFHARVTIRTMSGSTEPKSVQVQLAAGTGVDIEWQDGHRSHYSFSYLRSVCPCAACSARRTAEGRLPGAPRPMRFEDLGMLGAPVRAVKTEPVGKYALRFTGKMGIAMATIPGTSCKTSILARPVPEFEIRSSDSAEGLQELLDLTGLRSELQFHTSTTRPPLPRTPKSPTRKHQSASPLSDQAPRLACASEK
jgi:DUF971 family protein